MSSDVGKNRGFKKSSGIFVRSLIQIRLGSGDLEISQLKRRLEETERAMERIVTQLGAVTTRLTPHLLAMAEHCHHQVS